MRLWHKDLIPKLDRQRILGQHREICALRGLGWSKKHSTVDYVFKHSYKKLYHYHTLVMAEMEKRGYKVNPLWKDICYRGQKIGYVKYDNLPNIKLEYSSLDYAEHNYQYYDECIENLKNKGVEIKE